MLKVKGWELLAELRYKREHHIALCGELAREGSMDMLLRGAEWGCKGN